MTTATYTTEPAVAGVTTSTPRILLMFGPPGCGKGTQSRILASRLGVPCISTGDILRDAAASGGSKALMLKEIMDSGALVGDDVVNAVVGERIGDSDCAGGFILDGYPRTPDQVQYLESLLSERSLGRPATVVFDLPVDLLVNRLTARRFCPLCGRIYNLVSAPPAEYDFCDDDGMCLVKRSDDEEEAIRERFAAYDRLTAPLLRRLGAHRMYRVNAAADPDTVAAQIESLLAQA